MINTSTEFKQTLSENSVCIPRASIILKNGIELFLNNSSIIQGGIKIDDGVSGSGHFDIGSAIVNKLTLNLNNMYDEFSDYDFTDAVITVWIGKELADRVEWLKKGVFNADDPTATPSILTIEALDNMSKFDRAYDGNLSFPCNLQTIVQHCCTQCGVLLYNGQFPNYTYTIEKNPFDEKSNITYRALIAYCALLAGCYARCNADGRLELKWYDTTAFDDIIDGGVFDQATEQYYQTGDNLDGGNFIDYTSGDNADGGTFTEVLPYHHIYSFSSLSVSTEDVVITGIRVTAADSEDSAGNKVEGETYLCGAEGYILEVYGNPLIEAGKAKTVAEYLAGRIVGMRFRPFQASAIGDPSWEAGDAAIITDRKGNSYNTYITNLTYSVGSYASISCDAEPAARHSADRYSQIEQIVSDIKKDSQKQLSSYAKYVDQMNQLAINAMGYYETSETQSDKSTIHYMHDKPLLSESTIVYKKSIEGFFISRDGGQTYVGGMDKDANIVANVIAAIGISFDWAKGGTLTLGGDANESGVLLIRNKLGAEVARGDKDGITVSKGSISGVNIYGTDISGSEIHNEDSSFSVSKEGTIKSKAEQLCVEISGGTRREYTMINQMIISNSSIDIDTILKDGAWSNFTNVAKIQVLSDEAVTKSALRIGSKGSIVLGKIDDGNVYGGLQLDLVNSRMTVFGSLYSTGSKSRIADTITYGQRALYCYEMPTPMFGDIGEGQTDENGECYISIDDIFAETVSIGTEYQVFLQEEGKGSLWIADKQEGYFVVKGMPNLKFAWELKVKQRDYEYERLESTERLNSTEIESTDYESGYVKEMEELITEQEALFYETA